MAHECFHHQAGGVPDESFGNISIAQLHGGDRIPIRTVVLSSEPVNTLRSRRDVHGQR